MHDESDCGRRYGVQGVLMGQGVLVGRVPGKCGGSLDAISLRWLWVRGRDGPRDVTCCTARRTCMSRAEAHGVGPAAFTLPLSHAHETRRTGCAGEARDTPGGAGGIRCGAGCVCAGDRRGHRRRDVQAGHSGGQSLILACQRVSLSCMTLSCMTDCPSLGGGWQAGGRALSRCARRAPGLEGDKGEAGRERGKEEARRERG